MLILVSCFNYKNKQQDKSREFQNAIVLIGHLGENNKPPYPLIIRTDERDTSYFNLIGVENEKFKKTGLLISREYYRLSTINIDTYKSLKSYIILNNTHKIRNVFNADANTMKIILYDSIDSISYAITKDDTGYFSNMLETLKVKNRDKKFLDYILYYKEIHEWNVHP